MVPHRAHLFTFCSKVGILHFAAVKISWIKIFFCVTHRVHFFLPQCVKLLFWIVPHRAHPFTFYSKVCIPQCEAVKFSCFKIYFVLPIVHFFLTRCVKLLFWMVPHCFRITAFRKAWNYCFSYPKILHRSPPRGRVVVTGGEIRSRPAKGHPTIIGVAHTGGGPAQSSLGSPTSNYHK